MSNHFVCWHDDVGDGVMVESCHSVFLDSLGIRDFLLDNVPQYAIECMKLEKLNLSSPNSWQSASWWRDLCIRLLPHDDNDLIVHDHQIIRYRTKLGRIVDRATEVSRDPNRRNASVVHQNTKVWVPDDRFFVELQMTPSQFIAFKLKYEFEPQTFGKISVVNHKWINRMGVLQAIARRQTLMPPTHIV